MKVLKSFILFICVVCTLPNPLESKILPYVEVIPSTSEISQMENALIDQINKERKKKGLRNLSAHQTLSKHAKDHSLNMAKEKIPFGHAQFDKRSESVLQTGRYISFGENVAYSFHVENPLTTALDGWMKSQGHRDNILGDYHETGIGICYSKDGKCFITQLFGKLK